MGYLWIFHCQSVHGLSIIFISLGGTNETSTIHWFEGYFQSIFITFWFGSECTVHM